jgi:hypothetical protein
MRLLTFRIEMHVTVVEDEYRQKQSISSYIDHVAQDPVHVNHTPYDNPP